MLLADATPASNTAPRTRIVLVSGDEQLRSLLRGLLVAHGYEGVVGYDAKQALTTGVVSCDVAVVDVTSAHADAQRLLRHIKSTPAAVITIVAHRDGPSSSQPLDASSDVVLVKPFDPRELLLVIRGMLDGRTEAAPSTGAAVAAGPITLSTLLNAARVGAREVELTGVEARLLRELLRNAGNPVTRERLTRRGLLRDWVPDDRALDTHINRLRRKLGHDRRGRTPLRTVRGVGYRLLAEWAPE
jgi:two-component system phosphate regulon response regulator OmpR